MTSSELSDALNPYAGHPRSHPPPNYSGLFHQNVIDVQNYVPHRSELELAIPEAQPLTVETPQMQMIPQPTRGLSAPAGHPIHELIRALNATREAQERETHRRRAWEHEQEHSYRQKQIEMEQQMSEMRRQIATLQAALSQTNGSLAGHFGSPALPLNAIGTSPACSPNLNTSHLATGLFTPQYTMSPAVPPSQPHQPNQPVSPVSPVPQSTPAYGATHFAQGSSAASHTSMSQRFYDCNVGHEYQPHRETVQMQHSPPLQHLPTQQYRGAQNRPGPVHSNNQLQLQPQPPTAILANSLLPPRFSTPSPSPNVNSTEISSPPRSPCSPYLSHATSSRSGRKRSKADLSTTSSDTDSGSSESNPKYQIRRTNHHDRRCLTIHHAMRAHFLQLMQLEPGQELPDTHIEGVAFGPNDPVRFVWDKTTKQSVHNSRMKTRIMSDIKENSKTYKHVPRKDFNKKILEATFEQCFVTFRQKFRAQRDALTAQNLKKREDAKARRARHVSRRKIKLTNRADARERIEALHHVTFDGALQIECMSSEESDYETDTTGKQVSVLRTRGHAWRSQRLVRFYGILDESMPNKIKRGVGKKERTCGPVKEEYDLLPPKRVASWMISKRWMKAAQSEHSDLPSVMGKLIEEPAGFEWCQLGILGEDSEAEPELGLSSHLPPPQSSQQQNVIQHPHPHHHPPTGFHIPHDMSLNYNSQADLQIPRHYSTGISSLGYALSS